MKRWEWVKKLRRVSCKILDKVFFSTIIYFMTIVSAKFKQAFFLKFICLVLRQSLIKIGESGYAYAQKAGYAPIKKGGCP